VLEDREQAAALAGLAPNTLEQVLVARYPPGAGIGWHRDAPMFGPVVVGVSLGAGCVLRFRRGDGPARMLRRHVLARRSAYVLSGPARAIWQHSIPPVAALRYSVTFRTVRRRM
jgi:alkylated DNA repair dioxygenase AlkB